MQETEDDEVFEAESSTRHRVFNPVPRPYAHLHSVDSGYEATRGSSDLDSSPYDSAGRARSRSFAERRRPALFRQPDQQPSTSSSSNVETGGRALSRRATWPELPVDDDSVVEVAERHRIRTESMRSVGTQTSSLESLLEGLSMDDDDDDSDDDNDNVFCSSSAVGSTGPLPDVIQLMNERWPLPPGGTHMQNVGRELRHLADGFRASEQQQRVARGRRRTWSLQESFRLSSHIEIRARRWSVLGWPSSEHSSSSTNQQ